MGDMVDSANSFPRVKVGDRSMRATQFNYAMNALGTLWGERIIPATRPPRKLVTTAATTRSRARITGYSADGRSYKGMRINAAGEDIGDGEEITLYCRRTPGIFDGQPLDVHIKWYIPQFTWDQAAPSYARTAIIEKLPDENGDQQWHIRDVFVCTCASQAVQATLPPNLPTPKPPPPGFDDGASGPGMDVPTDGEGEPAPPGGSWGNMPAIEGPLPADIQELVDRNNGGCRNCGG